MFKFKTLAVIALMWFVNLQAQNHQWKEAQSGGYTYKYVSGDPMEARFYTLKNGLTVILSPSKKEPRIQSYIAVKAGSKTDPATNTGLAHYLEHLMFKGTKKYGSLNWEKEKPELEKINNLYEEYNHTKDAKKRKLIYKKIDSISGVASKYSIANEYDKMMTSMGAQGTNAFTSFEQTVYTDDVPSSSLDKYLTVQAERFRDPVFRIFHTELEAVYEEKNRSLDNDGDKVYETLMSTLYKNHNYGKQTTIGTVEHLKNPSLVNIRKYFDTYYVPNNMGIIMSGDFNPDEVIKKIDEKFGAMESKPVAKYTFKDEVPFTQPVIKTVVGPDAENLTMAYRLPNNKSKDILLARLVSQILSNGNAGLIDINLTQKQKLLEAGAQVSSLIDYGMFFLMAVPVEGQTLDQAKALLLGEINKLKKGKFDDDLIVSIVNNMKKNKISASESYRSRAEYLMDNFTSETDWQDNVAYVEDLSKITKQQVVDFANKYFKNNYVAVYKKQGKPKMKTKVIKPQITPIETNASYQSDFVKMVDAMPTTPVQPVFLDYDKDIQRSKLGNAEVLYVQNTTNPIYRLKYRYKNGSLNDMKLSLASSYLDYLGTDKKTVEQISKEFYKIASSFSVSVGEEYTVVSIEGLQENFTKAVKLYEELIANLKPDEEALKNLKANIIKMRADAKYDKDMIMRGLSSYAMYGPNNKFNTTFSDAELNALTSKELIKRIKDLNNYEQTVIYYGPQKIEDLVTELKTIHTVPAQFATPNPAKIYTQTVQDKNRVLFADYDMVQAETRWIRNTDQYNPKNTTLITAFNNYFGGGMSAIVFQTIRESKALAYSTYSYYGIPQKKDQKYTQVAYVGSQADKFNDATVAMNDLLNNIPNLPENLELAKSQVKKNIETERITQDGIIFNYLQNKELGINYDIRKDVYNNVNKVTFEDIKTFSDQNISGKPYTYTIVASEKNIKMEDMKKLGEVKKLTLKEIFGY